METIFTSSQLHKLKFLLLVTAILIISNNKINAATRTWVGAGYTGSGNTNGTVLTSAGNWNGGTALLATDDYVMTLTPTVSASITQGAGITQFNSLNINFTAAGSTQKIISLSFNASFNITGALIVTNGSTGGGGHLLNINVTAGTLTCGSVSTNASGTAAGGSAMYTNVSAGAAMLCNGSWNSVCSAKTGTYFLNNGNLTINGTAIIYNPTGNNTIGFLVGNAPATTTFNGDAKFDSTTGTTDYTPGSGNKIILGGKDTNATGSFYFNGSNIIFGYCMGTDSLEKGYFYFDGNSPQMITSYAMLNSPDRIPGTFQVGKLNNAYVDYELGSGINNSLIVNNALIVNNYSTLILKAIVVPSDGNTRRTDGLIQLKPYSTLKLGTKKGTSSSLPQNYKVYTFDPTSTVEFNGNNQTVYSGSDYGNVTITDGPDVSINGGLKTAGGSINILGNLKINANAEFAASDTNIVNGYLIKIKGNWTNNGSFYAKSDTVVFNGTSTQNINGTNASNFYTVIDSNINQVALGVNDTINNKFILSAGPFNLNNQTLVLNGAIAGSGTITGSAASGLILNSAAGTLNFTAGGTNNYLQTLTLNSLASATLGNALNISASNGSINTFGTVTVNSNANLFTNGKLTLKSDGYGTARVANSPGNITDSVIVERFIPKGRKWRFLSVPVISNQTINTAWQEGAVNPDIYTQVNPKPGYGTDITYNGTSGFDPNITTNTSLKIWDYTTKAWSASAPSTALSINNYPAYCIFVRGSRAVNLSQGTYAMQDSTVLRAKGILKQHNLSQSFSSVNAGDFVFVGNPYPSSVDLSNILNNASGIDKSKYWVWDPGYGGTYGTGGYVTYSNGVMSPLTGNYPKPSKIIQGGQAFFVQAGAASGSLSFQESDKSDSERNVFARQATPQVYPTVYTNLMAPQGNDLFLADGVAAAFGKNFSAAVDGDDAVKLWNFDENIALVRGASTLAIEFRPVPTLTDTLFCRLYLRQQPYVLKIFSQYLPQNLPLSAWLVDKYLNTQTKVNLYDTTLYNFMPNPDTNSYRNRFMLVFNRQLNTNAISVNKVISQSNSGAVNVANSSKLAEKSITVFPNPAKTTDAITLRFAGIMAGRYAITVFDTKGNTMMSKTIEHNGGTASYPLSKTFLLPGMYNIVIFKENSNDNFNLKLLIGS